MIDIQEHLSTIIIILLISIIIYLTYNYFISKQKIYILENKIADLNKIKYLENNIETSTSQKIANINATENAYGQQNTHEQQNAYDKQNIPPMQNTYAYANSNTNVITNTSPNSYIPYSYEQKNNLCFNQQTCEVKDINYSTQYNILNNNLKKHSTKIDISNCENEYSDNENYKLLNNNTIENYGVLPIDLNLLLHTAIQNKIDNNINNINNDLYDSESESESEEIEDKKIESDSDSESKIKSIVSINNLEPSDTDAQPSDTDAQPSATDAQPSATVTTTQPSATVTTTQPSATVTTTQPSATATATDTQPSATVTTTQPSATQSSKPPKISKPQKIYKQLKLSKSPQSPQSLQSPLSPQSPQSITLLLTPSNNETKLSNNKIITEIESPKQYELSEENLKNKNIIDIKEIAKKIGIKLSDKGKQKNKDILIQDILNK